VKKVALGDGVSRCYAAGHARHVRPEKGIARPEGIGSELSAYAGQFEYICVLRNKRTGNYIIEPMAKHPIGASAVFGAVTTISAEKYESEMTSAVLANLAKYNRQEFQEELAPKRRPPKEEREFLESHLSVSITRYPWGDIWIYPMQRDKGGYRGIGEKIVVPASEVSKQLTAALQEAFSKSG